jgi:hypothetical protein
MMLMPSRSVPCAGRTSGVFWLELWPEFWLELWPEPWFELWLDSC